jgi:Glycosyl transferase family 2
MNEPKISVIICTHNPRPNYFSRCLSALQAQTLRREKWELILVDNASEADKAPRPDLSWHANARLVVEEKLGLTSARLRAIREATGELLVFVDDDNVLDDDFLEKALLVADEKPFLGSWSGQCRPEFEQPPPEWTRRYWGNLVIREFDQDVWSNLPRLADTMPCGAGLCVRREVARYYLALHESGQRSMILDRVGRSLVSGGDNDLACCACASGLGVGIVAALKLTHLIPPERLTEEYLAKLAEGIHYSGAVLDHLYGLSIPKPSFARRIWGWRYLIFLRFRSMKVAKAVERGRNRARTEIARSQQI